MGTAPVTRRMPRRRPEYAPGHTARSGLGGAHQADRRRKLAAMPDGTPCPRCGGPMYKTPERAARAGLPRMFWKVNLDHVIPRVLGGTGGPAVLAHEHCNKSAGARLGNQIRAARRRQRAYNRW